MGKFLIIDDSALMRRVISDIIKTNSEQCEVLDIAQDGLEGFDKLVAHPGYYDLIILDINMPRMNGLELLEALHKNHMHENVVVVSTVAKEGTKETIKALELGALDFLTKPENFYEVKSDSFKNNLLNLISACTANQVNRKVLASPASTSRAPVRPGSTLSGHSPAAQQAALTLADRAREKKAAEAAQEPTRPVDVSSVMKNFPSSKRNKVKLVAIASSTGGPKSLHEVIPFLPGNLDAGVLLVQHMPKGFTASLAQRLDELSKIKVSEAKDGELIEKGHVYIAPGGRHMKAVKEGANYRISLNDDPPIDALRPCANVMYDSLRDLNYDEITCVVLTGMGADGTEGIRHLSEAHKNIYVISQDEATCVVYGMPRAVAKAGLSNEVQPLQKIAESIVKNVGVS